jgi:hypothetical protein
MPAFVQPFSQRVLRRLAAATSEESDPWLRDDLQIAHRTVLHAALGDAVECSAHVLASYEILGVHPEKVWPAICARREARGGPWCVGAPPKKPAQSVQLWQFEKSKARRALVSSAPTETVLREPPISVPMAAPSIAAAYPNSDAPSSGKKGEYSYDELVQIVERSGAPEHVRNLTLAALVVRGRWPKKQGPVSPVITVSVKSLQEKCGVWRSTIQRRIRRAQQDRFWRATRTEINVWLDCPACGTKRKSRECPNPKCGREGNGLDPREFPRTIAYAIDIEKFASTPPCRQVQQIRLQRAEVRQMQPRSREEESQEPPKQQEPPRQTSAHQRERTIVQTQVTSDAARLAQRVFEYCSLADSGLIAKITIGIVAEAKFQGIEIEAAAKYVAESALRDQKNGITLNGFYWRDLKWRTNGRQQTSAAQQRVEKSKQVIARAFGFGQDAGGLDPSDLPELKE